jgi:hypothetical protein
MTPSRKNDCEAAFWIWSSGGQAGMNLAGSVLGDKGREFVF